MQLRHSYYWFKSIISPEDCQKIIDLGLKTISDEVAKGNSVDAYTAGDRQKTAMPNASPQGEESLEELKKKGVDDKNLYVRDSQVAWLRDQWLYESFQFTQYKPSGFYSWHKDGPSDWFGAYKRYTYGITPKPLKLSGDPPEQYVTDHKMVGKIRKISMTLNLNTPGDYDGGNLKFDFGHHAENSRFHECDEIRPQGSLIVFPSFVDHCVTPITRGTRYSLVLWCLGDPWK